MFYFFILSNFKPVIIAHTWQQVARRIPLNLIYGTCRAYAENNCACGDDFEQAKIFIEGPSLYFK